MKKLAMLAAIVLFTMPAFAQVKVAQNGTITTYDKGATINIVTKDVAEVYYDGVLFTIPKGKRVIMSQNKEGNILITGDNLNGVRVLGQTLRSEKPATYVIDLKRNTILRAPVRLTASNQEQNREDANKDLQTDGQQTIVEVAFPEEADYVNEVASVQAVQDVEGQLSPSSPI